MSDLRERLESECERIANREDRIEIDADLLLDILALLPDEEPVAWEEERIAGWVCPVTWDRWNESRDEGRSHAMPVHSYPVMTTDIEIIVARPPTATEEESDTDSWTCSCGCDNNSTPRLPFRTCFACGKAEEE